MIPCRLLYVFYCIYRDRGKNRIHTVVLITGVKHPAEVFMISILFELTIFYRIVFSNMIVQVKIEKKIKIIHFMVKIGVTIIKKLKFYHAYWRASKK